MDLAAGTSEAIDPRSGPAPWVALHRQAAVAGDVVRLGDLADLSGAPAGVRAGLSGLVVARASAATNEPVSAEKLEARLRSIAPILAGRIGGSATVTVQRQFAGAAPSQASCALTVRPIQKGAALTVDAFERSDCDEAAATPYFYDKAARVVRASRDLSGGEPVQLPSAGLMAISTAGQTFSIETRIGAVAVSRQVRSVAPARAGGSIAVKGAQGPAFAAAATELNQ